MGDLVFESELFIVLGYCSALLMMSCVLAKVNAATREEDVGLQCVRMTVISHEWKPCQKANGAQDIANV